MLLKRKPRRKERTHIDWKAEALFEKPTKKNKKKGVGLFG